MTSLRHCLAAPRHGQHQADLELSGDDDSCLCDCSALFQGPLKLQNQIVDLPFHFLSEASHRLHVRVEGCQISALDIVVL